MVISSLKVVISSDSVVVASILSVASSVDSVVSLVTPRTTKGAVVGFAEDHTPHLILRRQDSAVSCEESG